ELVLTLRSEGVSEETVEALVRRGFVSVPLLSTMEELDLRDVAPNLGQARALSRLVRRLRVEQESMRPRARSASFPSRADFERSGLGGPGFAGAQLNVNTQMGGAPSQVLNQPPGNPNAGLVNTGMAAATPTASLLNTMNTQQAQYNQMQHHYQQQQYQQQLVLAAGLPQGLARRPSSAPSQQLLETPTYTWPAEQAPPHPTTPASLTSLRTVVPGQRRSAYTTTYTLPMELMKRERGAPVQQAHEGYSTVWHQRRDGGAAGDLAGSGGGQGQGMGVSMSPRLSRRTGPPIIVRTLTPETS
uniref:Uncharacterized protein n=1 Tax=Petromyzon marinus TaxID=7757 RepID=S4RDJ6_PETMA